MTHDDDVRRCRVFLVGEGPCDIGDLAVEHMYRGDDRSREGFLRPLLRKLAQPQFALEFDGQKIAHIPKTPTSHAKAFMRRKSAQALVLADQADADVLVFARDADRQSGTRASRVERRKLHKTLIDELDADIRRAQEADVDLARIVTIIAVPVRMIETWALGDPNALAAVLGEDPENLPGGSPEDFWGDEDDPASNHPKCVFARVLGEDASAGLLGRIAEHAEPAELSRSCPDSFGPFCRAVTKQVDECRGRADGE